MTHTTWYTETNKVMIKLYFFKINAVQYLLQDQLLNSVKT